MPETPRSIAGWRDPAEELPGGYEGWSDPQEPAGLENAAGSLAEPPQENSAPPAPTGEDLRQAARILARPLWLAGFALAGIALYCLVNLLILFSAM